MKKIEIHTTCKKMLADVYTPVGIYLRLRDRFRDTILLEGTDYHAAEKSFSFIGINAIAGIEISSTERAEIKLPCRAPGKTLIKNVSDVPRLLSDFLQMFNANEPDVKEGRFAQGLFGYTAYDAIQFFDTLQLKTPKQKSEPGKENAGHSIPLIRYRLYQYVIIVNHFKDELIICENKIAGLETELAAVLSLIQSKDIPVFPFAPQGAEITNMTDNDYLEMVKKGIQSCYRGDVFQVVLSRRFEQRFKGDEFNVYRALRNINPSPYLFFLDYGDYKLFGSSPEGQLIVDKGIAKLNPIAGTFRRTGDDETDKAAAEALLLDKKENAEHVMLVDLARNDLSRVCDQVTVSHNRDVQYFSHVIHLVSEVTGKVKEANNPFTLLANTFPAGTLSGAPKYRAMELIDAFEPTARGYYGGAIGFIGFDQSVNHAIMIRTFLSRNNTLIYQAGAGIVAASNPAQELTEINNKLGALKQAILLASALNTSNKYRE